MNYLRRFMSGRYGMDQLSRALCVLYLVLYLLGLFLRVNWLTYLALAVVVVYFFRVLSRNISKRRIENARYLEITAPLRSKLKLFAVKHKDRDHCYFKCPNCGQTLRVPKGKGRIQIHCRSCGAGFEEKS